MSRFLAALALLSLCLPAKAQQITVYWNLTNIVGPQAPLVSEAFIVPLGPTPCIINGVYCFPLTNKLTPYNMPSMTNGVVQTNLYPNQNYRFSIIGPWGTLAVTNSFPLSLTNSMSPVNASSYDAANVGIISNTAYYVSAVNAGSNVTVTTSNSGAAVSVTVNASGSAVNSNAFVGATNNSLTVSNGGMVNGLVISATNNGGTAMQTWETTGTEMIFNWDFSGITDWQENVTQAAFQLGPLTMNSNGMASFSGNLSAQNIVTNNQTGVTLGGSFTGTLSGNASSSSAIFPDARPWTNIDIQSGAFTGSNLIATISGPGTVTNIHFTLDTVGSSWSNYFLSFNVDGVSNGCHLDQFMGAPNNVPAFGNSLLKWNPQGGQVQNDSTSIALTCTRSCYINFYTNFSVSLQTYALDTPTLYSDVKAYLGTPVSVGLSRVWHCTNVSITLTNGATWTPFAQTNSSGLLTFVSFLVDGTNGGDDAARPNINMDGNVSWWANGTEDVGWSGNFGGVGLGYAPEMFAYDKVGFFSGYYISPYHPWTPDTIPIVWYQVPDGIKWTNGVAITYSNSTGGSVPNSWITNSWYFEWTTPL